MKGTKLVKKPEKPKKMRQEDDPVSPYLKDNRFSLKDDIALYKEVRKKYKWK